MPHGLCGSTFITLPSNLSAIPPTNRDMEPSIDPAALAQALAETAKPLAQARTLPGAVLTDPATLTREQRELFARRWLAVGREEDLPDPGSFLTQEIGAERVLVVRAEDLRLRAFYNVCRHRGARLVEEERGKLRGMIQCPYHAWSYGLDGSFRRAPRMQPANDDKQSLALAALKLATWEGFVFVNLDAQAQPFDAFCADLPGLARYRLPELRRAGRMDYEIAANWKIVCENYSECYHCPGVHPQLNRIADLSGGGFEDGAGFNGGPMRLRAGFETMSMSGRAAGARLCATPGEDSNLAHYYVVYPNLMLGIHPDYLVTHRVWPLAVDRSRIVCELFFAPETIGAAEFDAGEVREFWDVTNRQDWALCERVQRGAASRGYRPGPYHPSERCVHAFDRWYAGWLLALTGP